MVTKFSIKKNQDFWNKYSKKAKNRKFGAHSDSYIVDLENEFIVKQLKKIKANSLLDIGCGNGQRTILFQKYISDIDTLSGIIILELFSQEKGLVLNIFMTFVDSIIII